MKNRYGYSDKTETTNYDIKPTDQMSKEEILGEILAKRKTLAKLIGPSNVLMSAIAADESTTTN